MKKLVALFLVLVCILSLVGCSNENATGSITFYSEPTLERTAPGSVASLELSTDQVKELKRIIKKVKKWTNDAVVDRLPFYFDGEFMFSDSEFVYYFSYEYSLIYYGSYFAGISDEDMQFIKDINAGV